MHLRFAQGADVVLASPARLEVTDAQHIRLAYGKIRITAPPTAKGFTVATPAADYVDLGTEFGLRVDRRSGASDLYVFDGQVNVADPQSGKILSEVTEGESSRYVDGIVGAAPQFKENEFPTPGRSAFSAGSSTNRSCGRMKACWHSSRSARLRTSRYWRTAWVRTAWPMAESMGARWTSGTLAGQGRVAFRPRHGLRRD